MWAKLIRYKDINNNRYTLKTHYDSKAIHEAHLILQIYPYSKGHETNLTTVTETVENKI